MKISIYGDQFMKAEVFEEAERQMFKDGAVVYKIADEELRKEDGDIWTSERFRALSDAQKYGARKAWAVDQANMYNPNSVPQIAGKMLTFEKTSLTDNQRSEFAKNAINLRWGKGHDNITVQDMLYATRDADRGNSLWKVFNVVQEKLLRGGMVYNLPTGRQQTVRALTNIDEQVKVNKNLWELAEQYV